MDIAAGTRLRVPVKMSVTGERLACEQNIVQMPLPAVSPFIHCQSVEYRLIRCPLQVHIERGVNTEPTRVHFIGAVLIFQIPAHFLHEVWRNRIWVTRNV